MQTDREPAVNAPGVILALVAAFLAIHVGRQWLSAEADVQVLLNFAFIPARYDAASPYADELFAAGGRGAQVWTFLTYAFLHGDYMHLAVNSVWMLAFGSAVAWRFGTWRFLLFSALCAVAGAATHLALHVGEPAPVIGASAAISGHMAASMRFVFEAGGPLGVFRKDGRQAFAIPAVPLGQTLRRPQVLVFLLAWFGTNIAFGLGASAFVGEGATIAWEAHIGGFLAGLALFPLLDPKVWSRPGPEHRASGLRPPPDAPHDDPAGPRDGPD